MSEAVESNSSIIDKSVANGSSAGEANRKVLTLLVPRVGVEPAGITPNGFWVRPSPSSRPQKTRREAFQIASLGLRQTCDKNTDKLEVIGGNR